MKTLKRITLILSLILLGAGLHRLSAQSATMNLQVAPGTTSANCVIVPSQTVYCFTGGGTIYVSANGAAFVAYSSSTGITAISQCDSTGANCTPATVASGTATLTYPKSITVAAPTISATSSVPVLTVK